MRTGVRIAVDVGSVRVGVAASDPAGMLATPVATLRRDPKTQTDVAQIAEIAAERMAIEIVVGLPRGLSGREGAAAAEARRYAVVLARRVAPLSVRLVDERLSTVTAQRALVSSSPRSGARARRQVVDQVAAVVFLQAALDAERSTGRPPGEVVAPRGAKPSGSGSPDEGSTS